MYTVIKWIYIKIFKFYKRTQKYPYIPEKDLFSLWNTKVSMFVPIVNCLYYWYFNHFWAISMYVDASNYLVYHSSAPHHTLSVPWSPLGSSSQADRCPPCCWRDTDSLRRWSCCSLWEWLTRPPAHRSILHRTKILVISLIKTVKQ